MPPRKFIADSRLTGTARSRRAYLAAMPTSVSRLPHADRPRERLWSLGPAALTTAELLAILLGTGRAVRACSRWPRGCWRSARGRSAGWRSGPGRSCCGRAASVPPRPPGCSPPSSWVPALAREERPPVVPDPGTGGRRPAVSATGCATSRSRSSICSRSTARARCCARCWSPAGCSTARWCIPARCSAPRSPRPRRGSSSSTTTRAAIRRPRRRTGRSPSSWSAAGRLLDLPLYDHVIIAGDRFVSFATAGLL